MLLLTLIFILVLAVVFAPRLQRLWSVITLFKEPNIVENFLNMDAFLPTSSGHDSGACHRQNHYRAA